MMTYERLVALERSLRETVVLSVYIDGESRDPARRSMWRTELKNAITRVRKDLRGASHTEREGFRHAVARLSDALPHGVVALGSPGWMGFVSPTRVYLAEALAVRMPTGVRWGHGIRIAPAVRALKEGRPVVVAIVDSRSARVYRYAGATLEAMEHLRAHAHLEPPAHMGAAPRPGFHTGTRGRTGEEAAERGLRAGRELMLRELATRMETLAGSDGWLLVGGTPGPAREAKAALSEQVAPRAVAVPDLPIRSTEAEIADRAAAHASALRRREDLAAVRTMVQRADAGGNGVRGIAATRRALEAGAAQRLYFTLRLLEDHPAEADEILRLALDHDVHVDEVSGEGAVLLDAQGDGVGAALHFALEGAPAPAAPAPGVERAPGRALALVTRSRPGGRKGVAVPAAKKAVRRPTSKARRESGKPGGGQGRRDVVGESHVFAASGGATPGGSAEVRTMAAWGQGARGAAGYEDSGGSELVVREGQLLGGLTAGPSGEPTIDIHGGDRPGGVKARPRRKPAKGAARKAPRRKPR